MKDDAIIILDPVNQDVITRGLNGGVKTFVGGNCTVLSLIHISEPTRRLMASRMPSSA